MATHGSVPRQPLTLSGTPMSAPLRNVRTVSQQLVGQFTENVIPCATLPGDALGGDVARVTRTCVELAIGMLDGQGVPDKTDRLSRAAAGWAREGIPIDTIHHAIHEGFRAGLDIVLSTAGSRTRHARRTEATAAGLTVHDYDNVVSGTKLVVDLLDTMTTTVSMAYLRELRAVASGHHTAAHTLASALLSGRATATRARDSGLAIAERYCVLALAIPAHPDEHKPLLDRTIVARRKLRRLQAELACHCDGSVLPLLSVDGGTVLVPAHVVSETGLDDLITELSAAAEVPVTAALVTAALSEIPAAAERAHDVLDIVRRLDGLPGLYRFADLALEYQLTRPGPGRDSLGTLLDPIDEHPELLQTLRCHVGNNVNRKRTARELHIHPNTVDYRLRRIATLTGFDPAKASELWYLRSALVARSFRSPHGPSTTQETVDDVTERLGPDGRSLASSGRPR